MDDQGTRRSCTLVLLGLTSFSRYIAGRGPAKIMAEVQELDDLIMAEINRHRDCMADLAKRIIVAKRRSNAQLPFRRLPEELITYIFLLACSEGGSPLTPLRIGSICHGWRTIAWSTPELWSSVTVGLEVEEEAADIQLDLLKDWLSRAKQRPLSIVVVYRSEYVDDWSPPSDTLDLVFAYSKQWRSITFNTPEGYLGYLDTVQGEIPLLERLTIKGPLTYILEVFSVAPRLRSAAFKFDYRESEELGDISFPWSQLTELSFTANDIQTCLTVVERCSSLEHLTPHETLEEGTYQTSLPSRTIMINLDGVTSLHISPHGKASLFMDSISAPHLKDVAVLSPRHTSDFLCSLCALITRSGCAKSITRFSFVGHIPSEKEMMLFLSELHNLSELELDNDKCAPPFSNIFIDALHSSAPASVQSGSSSIRLPPNLISIRYLGPMTLDDDAFFRVLCPNSKYKARSTGDPPQVKLAVTHGCDENVNENSCLIQVESLRAQGFKVDMRFIGPLEMDLEDFTRTWENMEEDLRVEWQFTGQL